MGTTETATATATIKSNGTGRAEVDFMASAVNRNGWKMLKWVNTNNDDVIHLIGFELLLLVLLVLLICCCPIRRTRPTRQYVVWFDQSDKKHESNYCDLAERTQSRAAFMRTTPHSLNFPPLDRQTVTNTHIMYNRRPNYTLMLAESGDFISNIPFYFTSSLLNWTFFPHFFAVNDIQTHNVNPRNQPNNVK